MIKIGFFNVFKKKKEDELNLPDIEEGTLPLDDIDKPALQEKSVQGTDIQILIAKLDLINMRLQNIEQRISNLEQIAKQSQQTQGRW